MSITIEVTTIELKDKFSFSFFVDESRAPSFLGSLLLGGNFREENHLFLLDMSIVQWKGVRFFEFWRCGF